VKLNVFFTRYGFVVEEVLTRFGEATNRLGHISFDCIKENMEHAQRLEMLI